MQFFGNFGLYVNVSMKDHLLPSDLIILKVYSLHPPNLTLLPLDTGPYHIQSSLVYDNSKYTFSPLKNKAF